MSPVHMLSGLVQRAEAGWTNLGFSWDTLEGAHLPLCFPPTDLSNHLQSVLYFKGGFFF